MVALAQSVSYDGQTYPAGTDHTTMPAQVADAIRNPNAWVGGVAPALSGISFGKSKIRPADLGSAARARAALGLIGRERRWAPTGAISWNLDRANAAIGNNTGVLTSGVLQLVGGLVIPAGTAVTSITFVSGTQAAASLTNQWFCLVDTSLNVLAKTADVTSAAWAANTAKTLTLSAPYTPSADKAVYAGLVVAGTTMPDLRGIATGAATNGIAPILAGASTTGLTNPASLGATAGAITASGVLSFCYLS